MNARYTTATNDGFQHLVETSDYFITLCGVELKRGELRVYSRAVPGFGLCTGCKAKRDAAKQAEAAKVKEDQAEAAKNFWL